MLQSIRQKLGERQLSKLVIKNKSNASKAINLKNLKNVAILYIADEEDVFYLIKNYIEQLKNKQGAKNVVAIGYSNKKENLLFLNENKTFKFYGPNDLNWFFKPKPEVMDGLSTQLFDLVIDLSPSNCIPLKHILNSLKATIKIGPDESGTAPYYDLIIKMENTNIAQTLNEANKYLSLFCHKEMAS